MMLDIKRNAPVEIHVSKYVSTLKAVSTVVVGSGYTVDGSRCIGQC